MANHYGSWLDAISKLRKQREQQQRREADQKEYRRISRMFKGFEQRDLKEKQKEVSNERI